MRARAIAVVVLSAVLAALLCRRNVLPALTSIAAERARAFEYSIGGTQVLFVGNSFTSVNDLPRTFARVARSRGDRVGVDSCAPGGQTFDGHSKDPEVLEKIKARNWDYVVLQEQSQRAAFGPEQVETDTVAPALRLAAMIRAAHPAAKVVFYETWGRKDGDRDNCRALPNLCTYEGMQARLDESYALLARRASGLLAPVGEAWSHVRAAHPEIELYGPDGVHPSPQGTYLAACVFYETLLRKTAEGADPLGLDRTQALALQKAATESVLESDHPALAAP